MALAGFRTSTITLTSGTNSVNGFGFTPLGVIVLVSKKGSGTDNQGRLMIGAFDGTRKSYTEIIASGSAGKTIKDNTKPIFFQEDVSGTLTTRLDGTITLDSDGLTFTMTSADANWTTTYIAFG